ncbi:hypothetical protein ACVCL0_12365 [Rhodanobacter sp. UC4450_H17]
MESLKRIEGLAAARRSSFIGQAGVLSDLRSMSPEDAIAWLESHLASPIAKDWGQLLHALGASGAVLRRWFELGKEHALAAADAAVAYAESGNAHVALSALPALRAAAEAHNVPRLNAALAALEQAAEITPEPALDADLRRAEAILSGGQGLAPAARAAVASAPDHSAKWHALFHAMDRIYCVAVLDWKCPPQEQLAALQSLPVWAAHGGNSGLEVASAEFGSDEILLIALPAAQVREVAELAAPARVAQHRVAA